MPLTRHELVLRQLIGIGMRMTYEDAWAFAKLETTDEQVTWATSAFGEKQKVAERLESSVAYRANLDFTRKVPRDADPLDQRYLDWTNQHQPVWSAAGRAWAVAAMASLSMLKR